MELSEVFVWFNSVSVLACTWLDLWWDLKWTWKGTSKGILGISGITQGAPYEIVRKLYSGISIRSEVLSGILQEFLMKWFYLEFCLYFFRILSEVLSGIVTEISSAITPENPFWHLSRISLWDVLGSFAIIPRILSATFPGIYPWILPGISSEVPYRNYFSVFSTNILQDSTRSCSETVFWHSFRCLFSIPS